MLNILPLASTLNPPHQVAASIARVGSRLESAGVAHRMMAAGDAPADALLIVTGGTEHLALGAIERRPGPVFLLAHPDQNSLPAALEVLARLRQRGESGRIFLLGDGLAHDPLLPRLAGHLDARRRLQDARLGRLGAPSDWLVASMPSPESVTAAWGPTVVDIPLQEVRDAMRAADAAAVQDLRDEMTRGAAAVVEPSGGDLEAAARVAVALGEVVRRHQLDACTVRCFDLVMDDRTTGCLGLSWLQDQGVVAGCEGDVPATLTMLWLRAVTGGPGFMANPQDLDLRAHTLWLAHCTIARGLTSRYVLRSHFESSLGVGIEGELEPGAATLARIGGPDLRDLFLSDGEIVRCGASRSRCRTQVQVRLEANLEELLLRPLGNHHVLTRGHWAARLREYYELFV